MRKISLALVSPPQSGLGLSGAFALALAMGFVAPRQAHAQATTGGAANTPAGGGAPQAPTAATGGEATSPPPESPASGGQSGAAEPDASAPPTTELPPAQDVGQEPPGPKEGEAKQKGKKKKKPAEPSAVDGQAGSTTGGDFGLGVYPNADTPRESTDLATVESTNVDADRIFAEDFWVHTRPALELHGNFRVRADLFDQFSLGRIDPPGMAMWPRPLDDNYQDTSGTLHGPVACVSGSSLDTLVGCSNSTQAGANLRFRVEPTIIISNNLRIRSQIDLLDNLVMGSTSQGYSNFPDEGGFSVAPRNGYYPVSGESWSQNAPISGINSLQDSVSVKRAWAEYETPFGQARFGRMPDHFGLGLNHNAGDDIDGDAQSTVDRIAFATGLPSLGLHAVGAWDFPYEGPTSAAFVDGQPAYDRAQFDDVSAMNLILFRRVDKQLERRILARDGIVINGGMYLTYAFQRIANDIPGTCASGAGALDCSPSEGAAGYVRRGMELWTPDFFAEVKYKKFRAGAELVTRQGHYDTLGGVNDRFNVNQWGFAAELSQLLIEDKLKLGLYFGYASGDGDVDGIVPGSNGIQPQIGDNTISTFRFHPGYRVDMILNRHILSRVQGSYYVKPQVQYDFFKDAQGMRLGGRAEAIWTRAAQFMQAPGHQSDLGIELNASVYYQSRDGALNDDPDLLGGFFAQFQYGVLFPLSGLGYLSQELSGSGTTPPGLQTAQNLRLFLGVAY